MKCIVRKRRDKNCCVNDTTPASRNRERSLISRIPIGNGESLGMVRSLWAWVQGDPVFTRRVNGWLTIIWLVMIPVSLATGWVQSVVYVSALSLWALVNRVMKYQTGACWVRLGNESSANKRMPITRG